MTQEQVNSILTAICDEQEPKGDNRPNIEIMHGFGQYTVIDATFPAWELQPDGILRCNTSHGTRWIAVESIHCIGI